MGVDQTQLKQKIKKIVRSTEQELNRSLIVSVRFNDRIKIKFNLCKLVTLEDSIHDRNRGHCSGWLFQRLPAMKSNRD